MKRSLKIFPPLILLFLSFSVYAQYDSIFVDNYFRTYLLHLPEGYSESEDIPLVIAMHGGTGSAYSMQYKSQLSVKADDAGFIVVYPEGITGGTLGLSSWNAGWCCGYASDSDIDDVGFIDALLDTLIDNYSVDTLRIFATGMSNGGFMAYRLACELSDRIAAIAPVAASMSMTACNPDRAIPVISFHSYLDTNVPYDGGIGTGISNHYNSPQDSVLDAWAEINGCLVLNDTIISNSQYNCINRTNCNCDADVLQYVTQDGGHSWPGGNQSATGDSVSEYIDATDLLWSFFQQYTLECNAASEVSGIIKEAFAKVYPNPTNGIINIKPANNWNTLQVSVFNAQGEEILKEVNQTVLDISNLPAGLFFIKTLVDNNSEIHKIIKD